MFLAPYEIAGTVMFNKCAVCNILKSGESIATSQSIPCTRTFLTRFSHTNEIDSELYWIGAWCGFILRIFREVSTSFVYDWNAPFFAKEAERFRKLFYYGSIEDEFVSWYSRLFMNIFQNIYPRPSVGLGTLTVWFSLQSIECNFKR